MTQVPISHLETVMGTVVTIDVYPEPLAAGEQLVAIRTLIDRACAVLHHADEVFSTWRPDSVISRLRAGAMTAAEAPAEVADVIESCRTARELSAGWFDPWAMPGGFDPTGLVKGWAAERALAVLSAADGVSGVMVNAAGDIASSGRMPTGEPFRIGIAAPAAPRQLAAIIQLTGSIATSGGYERGAHLFDPHSGQPAARVASASVTGPDLGLADALATALAVAGTEGLGFIEAVGGYAGFTIGFDAARTATAGFPFAR